MAKDAIPAFLRIPPFPGASRAAFAGDASGRHAGDDQTRVERVIHRLRNERVGGRYWGEQPPLPATPYRIARTVQAVPADDAASPLVRVADKAVGTEHGGVWPVAGGCDPWHLVRGASTVYAQADDELVLVAALSGVPAFYPDGSGGWRRFTALDAEESVRRAVIDVGYRNPFTGQSIDVDQAISLCAFWRSIIDSNRNIAAARGFARWKRSTVTPLLWSGSSSVVYGGSSENLKRDSQVAIWRSRLSASDLRWLDRSSAQVVEVEDGFIRSAGLGADCVPPLSIVLDRHGIYFDPSRPSDLEMLIQNGTFDAPLLDRARRLREVIVTRGLTKYAAGSGSANRRKSGRLHLLVPGQVENDRAVTTGMGPATNLQLLREVRRANPHAHLIYKPHPDVEAGHRKGRINDDECLEIADEIVRDQPITALIAMVDEVHVNTSLAGFEALLRGKSVTTYGVPFYAGWGLTCDRGPVPERRSAHRILDELVAAALLLYPRYLDPVTKLPCPPEILISRLSEGMQGPQGVLVTFRRLQGLARQIWSRLSP